MMEFVIFSSGVAFLYAVDYLIDYLVFGSAKGKYSKCITTEEIKLLQTKRILRELTLEQVPVTPQLKQTKATYQPLTANVYNYQIIHTDIISSTSLAVYQPQDCSPFQPFFIVLVIIVIIVLVSVFYICKRWYTRDGVLSKSAISGFADEFVCEEDEWTGAASSVPCEEEEDEQEEWVDAVSSMPCEVDDSAFRGHHEATGDFSVTFGDFSAEEMRMYIEKVESMAVKPVIMKPTLSKRKAMKSSSEKNITESKEERKPEREAVVNTFKTDLDIGAGNNHCQVKAGYNKEFQKWQESEDELTAELECLEEGDTLRQNKTIFSAEEMFRLNPHIKTTFKDDLSQYSTELDVTTYTREQIEFAEMMAMEIMKENKQRKNRRRRKKN